MPVSRASAVGIIYEDLILLGKRVETYKGAPVSFPGYWSLFGGSVEKGESPIACAARELYEETAIKVSPHLLNYVTSFNDDSQLEFTVYAFESRELLIPTLNDEHTECGWFKLDSLKNFTEKIDPKIVECIEIYRRKRGDTANHFRKSPK